MELVMLVLTRKNQESVVVGGTGGFERLLKVTVLDIDKGKVRLGFEVDKDVPVHRAEVWERIQAGELPINAMHHKNDQDDRNPTSS
jgi:carbon storage regulator